jgi:prolyl oligopeptidase
MYCSLNNTTQITMQKISGQRRQRDEDPYLWLEDIESKKCLDWVKKQNSNTVSVLEKHQEYENIYNTFLKNYQSKDKIAHVSIHKKYLYNFWKDDINIRGVLRRTTFTEYRKKTPKWEIVLDIDILAKQENENWVYKGSCNNVDDTRSIISLSRGGCDATVKREFDLVKKQFILEGFSLKEAKSSICWRDNDHLFVGTNFGKNSMTKSGYPRIVKLWKRGEQLENAISIFEGNENDVSCSGFHIYSNSHKYNIISQNIDFYHTNYYLLDQNNDYQQILLPQKCEIKELYEDQLIVYLTDEWKINNKTYCSGSVLSFNLDNFMNKKYKISIIFAPLKRIFFEDVSCSKNYVFLCVLDNIISKVYKYAFNGGKWTKTLVNTPEKGSIGLTTSEYNDNYFLTYSSYNKPTTVYECDDNSQIEVKSLPPKYNPDNVIVFQKEAVSKDGTKIPYFVVCKKDMNLSGNNPTILYGYGGFESSETPYYIGTIWDAWIKHGGVYVIANIRGGGEFGPDWHQSAIKENKMKSYEDFIAVAENLIKEKITSPQYLGIEGGSNGGLLVGAVSMLKPALFNCVVCQVPLLDMKRYHKLLAGNSWMGEYGDPDDPKMWEIIKQYSPYHNVKPNQTYPSFYLTTSTKDDRVHPGHARKMFAKLKSYGCNVDYFENIEGGHGAASNDIQRSKFWGLVFTYFITHLIDNNKNKLSND